MRPSELAVTHRYVTVNGIQMHYVEQGSGPLVLLLHGFPENWWTWRYQLQALAEAGFRVVAPDLRGYNDTDKQGPYDLDTLADDVRDLLVQLGAERAHVVGHDWGGAVAWHFAARHPSFTERLAVLNCPHPAMMERALAKGRWSQLRRSWYVFFFLLPFLPERALTRRGGAGLPKIYRAHAADPANFGDEELRPLVEGVLKPGAATAMLGYYRAALRQALRDLLARRDRASRYPPLTMPSMLLWAMEDKALGYNDLVPGTERFAPGLRVVTVERCGHFLQAEQPARVNRELIHFLVGTARTRNNAQLN